VAKALGYSLDELGAALIAATVFGGDVEKAFTATRNSLIGLQTSAQKGFISTGTLVGDIEKLSKTADTMELLDIAGKRAINTMASWVQHTKEMAIWQGQVNAAKDEGSIAEDRYIARLAKDMEFQDHVLRQQRKMLGEQVTIEAKQSPTIKRMQEQWEWAQTGWRAEHPAYQWGGWWEKISLYGQWAKPALKAFPPLAILDWIAKATGTRGQTYEENVKSGALLHYEDLMKAGKREEAAALAIRSGLYRRPEVTYAAPEQAAGRERAREGLSEEERALMARSGMRVSEKWGREEAGKYWKLMDARIKARGKENEEARKAEEAEMLAAARGATMERAVGEWQGRQAAIRPTRGKVRIGGVEVERAYPTPEAPFVPPTETEVETERVGMKGRERWLLGGKGEKGEEVEPAWLRGIFPEAGGGGDFQSALAESTAAARRLTESLDRNTEATAANSAMAGEGGGTVVVEGGGGGGGGGGGRTYGNPVDRS
jgi:hypothetical protein